MPAPDYNENKPMVNNQRKEAENWNESEVQKWLMENEIGDFYETLKPINGKVLYQLYLMQVHTPEFYFKSLTKNDLVDIKSVASFSAKLKDLFEF